MRWLGLLFAATMVFVLIIPGFISFFFGVESQFGIAEPLTGIRGDESIDSPENEYPALDTPPSGQEEAMAAFNPQMEGLVALEDYICGVVAAEMPANFHLEALKAQAVAARTYAYKRLYSGNYDGEAIKALSAQNIAEIDQAYLTDGQLAERWGTSYEKNYSKIREAVAATKGEIMVYAGEPIEAVFHSSSAGMTVDAKNVWSKEYPYLKSVASGEEEVITEISFTQNELLDMLTESFPGIAFSEAPLASQLEILSTTEGGYVLDIMVGDTVLTGRQLREALKLKSTAFTIKSDGGNIVFTTRGYGHGVGMSQEGAQFMAENGYDYKDVLEHYYDGILISTTN